MFLPGAQELQSHPNKEAHSLKEHLYYGKNQQRIGVVLYRPLSTLQISHIEKCSSQVTSFPFSKF